jgi:adenosylcobinamide kinase/adenosylcobinamide-phosphate guanylyltransferase
MISLYIGGARSGKSSLAEQHITQYQLPTTYIATARNSQSMQARIVLHQAQRPSSWVTAEVPLELGQVLTQIDAPQTCIIVDCLTLWLTNQLMANTCLDTATTDLCLTLSNLQAHVVLVTTDVGQSLIPDDDMSQQFVCASGEMLQKIARIADNVTFCQAGLAIKLKVQAEGICRE